MVLCGTSESQSGVARAELGPGQAVIEGKRPERMGCRTDDQRLAVTREGGMALGPSHSRAVRIAAHPSVLDQCAVLDYCTP